jgi:hypothetical protein
MELNNSYVVDQEGRKEKERERGGERLCIYFLELQR